MRVPFRIALRTIRPRRLGFITIITVSSTVGIVIGTAALIVVMSLFNGFRNLAADLMTGFGPHIRLEGSTDVVSVHKVVPSAVTAVPLVSSRLIIEHHGSAQVAEGWGVSEFYHHSMRGLQNKTIIGTPMTRPFDGMPSVVVAAGIAETMGLYVGDTVRLLSPAMIERALRTMIVPSGRPAIVRGVFQSNASREIDFTQVYTDSLTIIELSRGFHRSVVDVTLADRRQAVVAATDLRTHLPNLRVSTWEDLHRGLTDTMKLERIGTFIVLALIVVVAAFNILVSLTLTVVEKRKDIAILRTLGLTAENIRTIYLWQGLFIGVLGTGLGMTIGTGLALGQQHFGWIGFDQSQGYIVSALPMDVHLVDVVLISIVGLMLAIVAALYPARRASHSVISEALRGE